MDLIYGTYCCSRPVAEEIGYSRYYIPMKFSTWNFLHNFDVKMTFDAPLFTIDIRQPVLQQYVPHTPRCLSPLSSLSLLFLSFFFTILLLLSAARCTYVHVLIFTQFN